jgi:hypothetical protein
LEFQEAFLRETVDLLAFFPLESGAQMGERGGAFDLDPMDGSPPFPTLANPLPFSQFIAAAPTLSTPLATTPSLSLSSPSTAALYPLHGFLLTLDLPHAARIEKKRSTLN